jgi:rare lipoprotein A
VLLSVIYKYSLICLIIYFTACTPAPRYHSSIPKKKTSISKSSTISSKNKNTKKKEKKSSNKKKQPKFNPDKKSYKGLSSYYGKQFHGKLTANGEVYDMYGLTAAHKTFPLNTICRVTNLSNSKSLIIRINDRGPYIGDRILDCSYGAAKKLDFLTEGVTEVKIDIIEWGDNIYMHHKKD